MTINIIINKLIGNELKLYFVVVACGRCDKTIKKSIRRESLDSWVVFRLPYVGLAIGISGTLYEYRDAEEQRTGEGMKILTNQTLTFPLLQPPVPLFDVPITIPPHANLRQQSQQHSAARSVDITGINIVKKSQ